MICQTLFKPCLIKPCLILVLGARQKGGQKFIDFLKVRDLALESCAHQLHKMASLARSSSRDWWTWTSEALKWLWTVLFIYCQKSVRKIDRYLAKCCFLVSYKTNNRKLWLRCGGGGSEAVHKNNNTDIYKTREKYRENICRPFCSHLSSLAPPPTLLFSTRTSHNHQDHIINSPAKKKREWSENWHRALLQHKISKAEPTIQHCV